MQISTLPDPVLCTASNYIQHKHTNKIIVCVRENNSLMKVKSNCHADMLVGLHVEKVLLFSADGSCDGWSSELTYILLVGRWIFGN